MKEDKNIGVSLPQEAIREFMKLYEEACKKKISFEKAEAEALNFLELFFLLQKNHVAKNKYGNEKLHNSAK